jgi:dienelactone hydrolase
MPPEGGPAIPARPAEILPQDVLVDLRIDEAGEQPRDRGTLPAEKPRAATGQASSAPGESVPSYDPLARGRKVRRRPFVRPLGQRGWSHYVATHKFAVATLLGALLTPLTVYTWRSVIGVSLAWPLGLGAVAIGILISLFGFLLPPGERPSRKISAARAKRAGSGFLVGVIGIILTLIVLQAGWAFELATVFLVLMGIPLVAFVPLVLATGVVLFYYLLVGLFPRITGFQIASGTYLTLFVILPLLTWLLLNRYAPELLPTAVDRTAGDAVPASGSDSPELPTAPAPPPLEPPRDSVPPVTAVPRLFRVRTVPQPGFPFRDETRPLAAGVEVVDVLLDVSADQPGHNNRLRIYTPSGTHAANSLPCVLMAPDGTDGLSGGRLGDRLEHPERIPFVRAGFAVVAYELDGELTSASPTDAERLRAYRAFAAADAGVVNGRHALEYVLARVPEVDPARIFAVGHGAAANVALLLAQQDPRIGGCVAFAGIYDLQAASAADVQQLAASLPGGSQFLTDASPITRVARLSCPVMLFHAADDPLVPPLQAQRMADAMDEANQTMQLAMVPAGGHYDAMLDQGIPRAIEWLRQIAAEAAE